MHRILDNDLIIRYNKFIEKCCVHISIKLIDIQFTLIGTTKYLDGCFWIEIGFSEGERGYRNTFFFFDEFKIFYSFGSCMPARNTTCIILNEYTSNLNFIYFLMASILYKHFLSISKIG